MAVKRLDRNRRYSQVYGDEAENPTRPRKFYQDGMYFDGAGVAIEGSQVPKHTPPPSAADEPDDEAPVGVDTPDNSEAIKMLKGLSVPKLKALAEQVHEATGKKLPEGGAGVKNRLIGYIIANSE